MGVLKGCFVRIVGPSAAPPAKESLLCPAGGPFEADPLLLAGSSWAST